MMPSIKSVLCPIDFSEGSAHALEQAVAVASWYNARLTALHVYSPLLPVPGLPVDHVPESELQPVRREATDLCRVGVAARDRSRCGRGMWPPAGTHHS